MRSSRTPPTRPRVPTARSRRVHMARENRGGEGTAALTFAARPSLSAPKRSGARPLEPAPRRPAPQLMRGSGLARHGTSGFQGRTCCRTRSPRPWWLLPEPRCWCRRRARAPLHDMRHHQWCKAGAGPAGPTQQSVGPRALPRGWGCPCRLSIVTVNVRNGARGPLGNRENSCLVER